MKKKKMASKYVFNVLVYVLEISYSVNFIKHIPRREFIPGDTRNWKKIMFTFNVISFEYRLLNTGVTLSRPVPSKLLAPH